MLHPYHPVKAMLAILCMLLFLGCLGVLAWSANRAASVNGPIHIAADATGVYVSFNNEILVLDTDGGLVARQQLDTLGISDWPIDLRVDAEGALLIATQNPASLHLCDVREWQCRAVHSALFEELRSQIKVLPDLQGMGYFISDTAGGRLYWMSADGATTRALAQTQSFKVVNDIALDAQQRLWVADSGHHRLVVLEQDANGEWDITSELSANTALARPGLDWPMMIAFSAAGNAWVAQPSGRGGQSDLLIYDAQQGAKARVELPGERPTDVARLGDSMLVTDRDGFRIDRVAIASHAVTPFGDDRVQQVLADAAAGQARFERLKKLALQCMLLFGALMIALAVWASPRGKRFTPLPYVAQLVPGEAGATTGGELHWLLRDAKTEKFLSNAKAVLILTTLALVGVLAFSWIALDKLVGDKALEQANSCVTSIAELLIVFAILALGAPWLSFLGFRSMRNQLGSDGHYLHVRTHEGRHLTLDPARLVYNKRALAFEDQLFPIQTGNRKPLYAAGEVETHLAPLLHRARRLGVFAMLRYQFRHREPATMVSLVYIVSVVAVLWYTGLWRVLFSAI